jgi:hypothetical protein
MYICEAVEQARPTCIIERGDLLFIVHFSHLENPSIASLGAESGRWR